MPTVSFTPRSLTPAVLAAALLAAPLIFAAPARAAEQAQAQTQPPAFPGSALEPVLTSKDLVFNGVTRSADGRLFSPFQRQEKDTGVELGEWVDGRVRPYPDAAWNAWKRGDDPTKAFVGANAIRVGPDGALWVIDKGADAMNVEPLQGGPKLVRIDLATNAVTKVYPLQGAVRGKSFFDDFRFNGGRVYITDAGTPAVVVLDLATGETRRVLEGAASATAQRPLTGEGRQLVDPKGRPIFIHADQLEVSPDGRTFYYQPCTGPLYRIETRYLDDASLSDAERETHVAVHAQTGSTGGTAIDADGTIYASDTDGLRVLKIAPDGTTTTLVQDGRLVWVDAMWIDEAGNLWLPAAQMDLSKAMNGGVLAVRFPTTVFRLALGVKPLRN